MKPFTRLAAVFFVVLCVIHALRFALGWEVTVNGLSIPVWPSGLAALAAGILAVMLWRESRR